MNNPYPNSTRIHKLDFLFQEDQRELRPELSFLTDYGDIITPIPAHQELLTNTVDRAYRTKKQTHRTALLFTLTLSVVVISIALKALTGISDLLYRIFALITWGGVGIILLLTSVQHLLALRICDPVYLALSHAVSMERYRLRRFTIQDKLYFIDSDEDDLNKREHFFLKLNSFTIKVPKELFLLLNRNDPVTIALIDTSDLLFVFTLL